MSGGKKRNRLSDRWCVFFQNDRKMSQILSHLEEQNTALTETRSGGGSTASDDVITKLETLDGNLNHRSEGRSAETAKNRSVKFWLRY